MGGINVMAIISNQAKESIVGKVLKITFEKSGVKYLIFERPDGLKCGCKSEVSWGKNIDNLTEGIRVKLFGKWKISNNPKYKSMGEQFHFSDYELLPSEDNISGILAKAMASTPAVSHAVLNQKEATGNIVHFRPFTADVGVAEQIIDYLKKIGEEKITYGSPSPKQETISWHVRQQLDDRVIRSTAEEKDFYFLTAFFDRHVPDRDVQLFRHTNRDFKGKLLLCWKEVTGELDVVISDIGRALADRKKLNLLFNESTTLRILADTVPGEYGIEQLLVCLKIIRAKYDLTATRKIVDLIPNMTEENALKQYLIGIHGVKHKIANWALTNVTGHWFVIDDPNIKPLLKTDLADTIPAGLEVSADNADAIFEHWFGELDEKKKEYEKLSQAQFNVGFPDFPFEACEYLPFIVTQYLWFYGRCRWSGLLGQKTGIYKKFIDL